MSYGDLNLGGLDSPERPKKTVHPHSKEARAPKFILKPITKWEERTKEFRRGTWRVYCGGVLVGHAIPREINSEEFYHFDSHIPDVVSSISIIGGKGKTLEDILIHVECSMKEFINKLIK